MSVSSAAMQNMQETVVLCHIISQCHSSLTCSKAAERAMTQIQELPMTKPLPATWFYQIQGLEHNTKGGCCWWYSYICGYALSSMSSVILAKLQSQLQCNPSSTINISRLKKCDQLLGCTIQLFEVNRQVHYVDKKPVKINRYYHLQFIVVDIHVCCL